jgi:hypothetical protein
MSLMYPFAYISLIEAKYYDKLNVCKMRVHSIVSPFYIIFLYYGDNPRLLCMLCDYYIATNVYKRSLNISKLKSSGIYSQCNKTSYELN